MREILASESFIKGGGGKGKLREGTGDLFAPIGNGSASGRSSGNAVSIFTSLRLVWELSSKYANGHCSSA